MNTPQKQMTVIRVLTLLSLAVMVASYFVPIWWVSLTAPNYPKDAFPDGIRIHFHFNGVFNGCKSTPAKTGREAEILQADLGDDLTARNNPGAAPSEPQQVGLDCVHEMNTINHYVGMYPIASGAPIEREFSPFFYGFFAVMMLGFMAAERKNQLRVLGVGFLILAGWMVATLYGMGGIDGMVHAYQESASSYFKEPEKIARWAGNLRLAANITVIGLIAAMLVVVGGVWKIRRFTLLLAIVPALLPLFFILDYAGWLWFFGHNLNPWGAFTVKPFMPTVFGEGKVAQFSTFSYPHYGFAFLLFIGMAMGLAGLIRNKILRQQGAS